MSENLLTLFISLKKNRMYCLKAMFDMKFLPQKFDATTIFYSKNTYEKEFMIN